MSDAAILQGLNDKQQLAVSTTQGPLLIMAGAGSGKTRVLTHRIAYLIQDRQVLPWHILAITFTNKAAREMQERVQKLLGESAQGVWVSTFHSMCVRILRREAEAIGYSRAFTITGSSEQLTLVKQILKRLNLDPKKYDPRSLLHIISNAKNSVQTPEDYQKVAASPFEKIAVDVYQQYQKSLQDNQSMDFDDLIMQTIILFQTNPQVLQYYQDKFQYIHVDEYQDTNDAQYQLIYLLAQKHQNLCVVGDGDQSIYGWRGANMDNIMNFEKDYPTAQTILLEQNYRSTQNILQAANDVIAHNNYRKPKKLWTDNPAGELITYYRAATEKDEAIYVIEQIKKLQQEQNYHLTDFAILYRTNAQSRILEDRLLKANLPYKIIGGHKFYDRKEIKDTLAYLQLIANPKDSLSFQRIINEPKRGIGAGSLEKLQSVALEQDWSLLEVALNADTVGNLTTRVKNNLQKFAQFITELIDNRAGQSMTELLTQTLEKSGYVAELERQDTLEAQTRLENIQELLTVTQQFDKDYQPEDENADRLVDFLADLALVSSEDRTDDKQDQLTLMTLHAAKGLEFPVVFLVGMEEGIFPLSRSLTDDNELEEERRLAYVGITRAQTKLYVTSAWSRMLYGRTQSNVQSRFIDEISTDLLDVQNNSNMQQMEADYPFENSARSVRRPRKHNQPPKAPEVMNHFATETIIWQVGDQVQHKKWGTGTVVKVTGSGENTELDVAFSEQGIKRLLAEFAPIQKV
ncbi:DNA helicase PcrA [Bombilactobacillus thymidiniphilus]|uniref:ATP-dependent DNA helicase n=1 Tax=Bombilactobacillus thymidiniphilus TaxID=2923363 RepID=A0ABY4PD74_9LACO|nr:DNA helicase PcrA [Bombilactobacillus thymidiniphilus]UQS83232.1 DNA helicase PcrA [Bombilactobacillus thymidiniphilus]